MLDLAQQQMDNRILACKQACQHEGFIRRNEGHLSNFNELKLSYLPNLALTLGILTRLHKQRACNCFMDSRI